MVRDSSSSYKRDCYSVEELSKSHQWFKSHGHFTKGVNLPIGGFVSGRVCAWSLSSRLVLLLDRVVLLVADLTLANLTTLLIPTL